jgi:peptidoglycan/LPS O-acetylase OafA/YrhL
MPPPAPPRLIFANQLRGFAALCVAVSHLVGVYWGVPAAVGMLTFTHAHAGTPPAAARALAALGIDLGPFGVGVFFLISGLVIPISLQAHTPARFLLARALRIYPTYLAALAVQVPLLWWNAQASGIPFAHAARTVLLNALLVFDLAGLPSLDWVNWTLCVELKFYLLAALLAAALRAGRLLPLFAAALAALALEALWARAAVGGPDGSALHWLSVEVVFLPFLLIGTLFNYRLRGRLGVAPFLGCVAAMLAIFLAAWRLSAMAADFAGVVPNYLYALALFAALFALRNRARAAAPLDALAAISYPLYVTHGLVGYSALRWLTEARGLPFLPALALAFALVTVIATLLHVAVERPTIALGRRLAARGGRPGSLVDAVAHGSPGG